jgi:hypothetical protein
MFNSPLDKGSVGSMLWWGPHRNPQPPPGKKWDPVETKVVEQAIQCVNCLPSSL